MPSEVSDIKNVNISPDDHEGQHCRKVQVKCLGNLTVKTRFYSNLPVVLSVSFFFSLQS